MNNSQIPIKSGVFRNHRNQADLEDYVEVKSSCYKSLISASKILTAYFRYISEYVTHIFEKSR